MARRLNWLGSLGVLAAVSLLVGFTGAPEASAQPDDMVIPSNTDARAGLQLQGNLDQAAGTALADANGLMLSFDSTAETEPIIYPANLWGQYPLYLPGGMVHAVASMSNEHIAQADLFVLSYDLYQVTPEGPSGRRSRPQPSART